MEGQHTFPEHPFDNYDNYVLSMDYGPGNVSVIGLFGIKRSIQENHYHLLDEFYYDVTDPGNNGRQLTDSELADAGINLMNELPLTNFHTPHDASSFRAVLKKKKYRKKSIPMVTYTPDVLNDIQVIQELLSSDEPRFKISTKCENSISQAQSYSWDPKSQARGEDKPLKVNDHCPDMWRGAILGSRSLGNNPFTTSDKRYEATAWD
jgi:hypothetical protein